MTAPDLNQLNKMDGQQKAAVWCCFAAALVILVITAGLVIDSWKGKQAHEAEYNACVSIHSPAECALSLQDR